MAAVPVQDVMKGSRWAPNVCRSQACFAPHQRKTPWDRVDSGCIDCPGFGVLDVAPAPVSTFVSEPQIVRLA